MIFPGAVSFNDALAAGRGMKLNKPQLTREDVAFLQYTGGTTGVSKGATLLHKNILANVAAERRLLQPALKKTADCRSDGPLSARCRSITSSRLTACYLLGLRTGGHQPG